MRCNLPHSARVRRGIHEAGRDPVRKGSGQSGRVTLPHPMIDQDILFHPNGFS